MRETVKYLPLWGKYFSQKLNIAAVIKEKLQMFRIQPKTLQQLAKPVRHTLSG